MFDPNAMPMDPALDPATGAAMAADPTGMGGPPTMPLPGGAPVAPPAPTDYAFGVGDLDPLADPAAAFDPLAVPPFDEGPAAETGPSALEHIGLPPELAVEESYGPTLTERQMKMPEPDLDEVLEDIEVLKVDHAERLRNAEESVHRHAQDIVGLFKDDVSKLDTGEVEPGILTDLTDEAKEGITLVAQMNWGVRSLYREAVSKEEAATKEDAVRYFNESDQRQHRRVFGSRLKEDMAQHAILFGALVGFDGIDPMQPETGLQMRLIDPQTVFPFGAGPNGPAAVYRCYKAGPSELIDNYDDEAGTVRGRIEEIVADHVGAGGVLRPSMADFELEAVEYWNDVWFLLAYGSQLVKTEKHNYGRVPFTIAVGGAELSPVVNTSAWADETSGSLDLTTGHLLGGASRRSRDIARQWAPFLKARWQAHDQDEKILSRTLTGYRNSFEPATVLTRTNMSADDDMPDVKTGRKQTTELQEGEKLEVPAFIPDANLTATLLGISGQNKSTGMAAGTVGGMMQHSQNTGTAMDIAQAGQLRKFTPVIAMIEGFLTDRNEWRLELVRDWGETFGYTGDRGKLWIPRRGRGARPGDSPVHVLTPEVLRRSGCRVEITLRRFNPETLAGRSAGITMLRGAGLLSDYSGVLLAGFAEDPDEELERLERDKLNAVPEVQQEQMLAMLADDVLAAEASGDEWSWLRAKHRLWYIEQLIMENQLARQARMGMAGGGMGVVPPVPGTAGMGGSGAGMDPAMPGTPIGNNRAAPPQGAQGQSMPMMGGSTGAQGGAPPKPKDLIDA